MIDDYDYKNIVDWSEFRSFGALWSYMSPDMIPSLKFSGEQFPFQTRKEIFFYFVKRLLKEGRVKLAKKGHMLTGTIDEQLKIFHDAFPNNEDGMYDPKHMMEDYWFYDDSCPAGAVWVHNDGTLEWT
ncbi:DUF596 domain-containing protein [Gilliamella apicola]|uniref:DUF596 domain-containing protein n=1 Tax=Gilliamella apicola TaxID=1196095 RepID=A0A2V4DYF6_9GAMM|nr:DUF596 domain-containing protein [Gilliamella apicola]PXZ03941.1 hypothetical protein DKK79_06050 [Gilliamella apicola]